MKNQLGRSRIAILGKGTFRVMSKTLTYLGHECLPKMGDATEIRFSFSVIDTSLIGIPEQHMNVIRRTVVVKMSGTLQATWRLQSQQLEKVAFEFAKRHLIKKVAEGTASIDEIIDLNTSTAPATCPYDPERIAMTVGDRYEVSVQKPLGFHST